MGLPSGTRAQRSKNVDLDELSTAARATVGSVPVLGPPPSPVQQRQRAMAREEPRSPRRGHHYLCLSRPTCFGAILGIMPIPGTPTIPTRGALDSGRGQRVGSGLIARCGPGLLEGCGGYGWLEAKPEGVPLFWVCHARLCSDGARAREKSPAQCGGHGGPRWRATLPIGYCWGHPPATSTNKLREGAVAAG